MLQQCFSLGIAEEMWKVFWQLPGLGSSQGVLQTPAR